MRAICVLLITLAYLAITIQGSPIQLVQKSTAVESANELAGRQAAAVPAAVVPAAVDDDEDDDDDDDDIEDALDDDDGK